MKIDDDLLKDVAGQLKMNIDDEIIRYKKDIQGIIDFIGSFTEKEFDVNVTVKPKGRDGVTLNQDEYEDRSIDLSMNTEYFEKDHFVVPKIVDRD